MLEVPTMEAVLTALCVSMGITSFYRRDFSLKRDSLAVIVPVLAAACQAGRW